MTTAEFRCSFAGLLGLITGSVCYTFLWFREPASQYWGSVNTYRETWLPWYAVSYGLMLVGFFLLAFSVAQGVRSLPSGFWKPAGWMVTVLVSVLIIAIAFRPRY